MMMQPMHTEVSTKIPARYEAAPTIGVRGGENKKRKRERERERERNDIE